MIESVIAGREVLYVCKAEGCSACEVAELELQKFERRHPTVVVLRLDAMGPIPESLGLKVKATPTYLFRRGGEGVVRSGVLKMGELEKWIRSSGGVL